ncbi:hypothetical protein [Sphingomonas sp. TWP1-3-1]|uniref:hypothetical protein n=1 Tax=Sphingomonas sp. TWP1-3-1 TaxID=2804612 RepID=UPI003CF6E0CE
MKALVTLGLVFSVGSCAPAAPDPIGAIVGGITAGKVLDKFEATARALTDNATRDASLLSSKAARDAQLLISAVRGDIADELDKNWDRLSSEKILLLRAVNEAIEGADKITGKVGTLQDIAVLDVDNAIKTLPFTDKSPVLRRVDGAALVHRPHPDAVYVVTLTGSIFGPAFQTRITVAGKPIMGSSLVPDGPYRIKLLIPGAMLNSQFRISELSTVNLDISSSYVKKPFLGIGSNKTIEVRFPVTLQLIPRAGITYRLTEHYSTVVIDKSSTQIQKGEKHFVPGCGRSGCWLQHHVCTDAPPGSEVVGVVNRSVDGPAAWYRWDEPYRTPTGYCATFWQNKHDSSRNVSLDISYHPQATSTNSRVVLLRLGEIPLDSPSENNAKQDELLINRIAAFCGTAKELNNEAPAALCITPLSAMSSNARRAVGGYLGYGRTYVADFSPRMVAYELVLRSFTGETMFINKAKGSPKVDASLQDLSNFKQLTITPKDPF